MGSSPDNCLQPVQGVGPVLILTAKRLSLDDEYAVVGDPLILPPQQSRLDRLGQRRGVDIETQVNGRGHLVDVLPPGPLGADGRQLHFVFVNLHPGDNPQGEFLTHDHFFPGMVARLTPDTPDSSAAMTGKSTNRRWRS